MLAADAICNKVKTKETNSRPGDSALLRPGLLCMIKAKEADENAKLPLSNRKPPLDSKEDDDGERGIFVYMHETSEKTTCSERPSKPREKMM